MAFKEVNNLEASTTIALGGFNKKERKDNPTTATGYYLGSRTVQNKLGESKIHVLQTPKGNLGVWGKTDMDRRIAQVAPGSMIRITYAGTAPTPRGEMHKFKVEVDADDSIEPPVQAVASTVESAYNDGQADAEDTDVDADSSWADEVEPARPVAPARAAATPDAARQKKVQDLLKSRKTA